MLAYKRASWQQFLNSTSKSCFFSYKQVAYFSMKKKKIWICAAWYRHLSSSDSNWGLLCKSSVAVWQERHILAVGLAAYLSKAGSRLHLSAGCTAPLDEESVISHTVWQKIQMLIDSQMYAYSRSQAFSLRCTVCLLSCIFTFQNTGTH